MKIKKNKKNIRTLVQDIYGLIDTGAVELNTDNIRRGKENFEVVGCRQRRPQTMVRN